MHACDSLIGYLNSGHSFGETNPRPSPTTVFSKVNLATRTSFGA